MRRRLRVSIGTKLIALTAMLIAAIVGFLTAYFPSQQIETMRDEQLARVGAYGQLLSVQARSAVAFSDHETAREVLTSLDADRDVVAAALFVEDGEALYIHGTPSKWITRARHGVVERRVVQFEDRVAVVEPVESLEGPRGTLVIELSMARFQAHQETVIATATAVGVTVLALGVLVMWLIARSLARRLRAINDIASAVASGSTENIEARVDSDDEIGRLAHGFNFMLAQVRADQRSLQVTVQDLRVAEDELAQTNRELEQRVDLRTRELTGANAQLHTEMAHRTQIELELRQAQKLESVGRLAAGIAHEINTPVQFVSDSCSFIESATTDLLKILAIREEARAALEAGQIDHVTALARGRQADADHDLEYLTSEMPAAIKRALGGLERVAAIVRAMKEFAYTDRSEQAGADINRAILSTLTVAHNEYKYVADVTTNLAEIPTVTCHIGELNQVILNIIVNAAHAIETTVAASERRGTITVTTRATEETVFIDITDDGCGIPQTHLDKIFDPFFTTKDIGKGTGQGLAIARSVIVDKHRGKLLVESTVGQGSKFSIQLPISGAPTVAHAEAA